MYYLIGYAVLGFILISVLNHSYQQAIACCVRRYCCNRRGHPMLELQLIHEKLDRLLLKVDAIESLQQHK